MTPEAFYLFSCTLITAMGGLVVVLAALITRNVVLRLAAIAEAGRQSRTREELAATMTALGERVNDLAAKFEQLKTTVVVGGRR